MKISLVELPATLNGKLWEKPARDFYSIVKLPSRAIPILHAVAQEAGFTDVVQINPGFNKKKMLTKEEIDRLIGSDVVGISTITRTAPQSYELAALIKEYSPSTWVIMGGTHVSHLSEEALKYCDIVVRKEGDKSFPEILHAISQNSLHPNLKNIKGISYKEQGQFVHNEERPFLTNEELSDLPFPIYRDVEVKESDVMVLITSRGCPYKCEYCSVIENFGNRFRYINDERVMELIEYGTHLEFKKLFFADDSFAANPKRTKRLLSKILDRNLAMPRWSAQVRVETAYDDELLSLMTKSGCNYVYTGLESVNPKTLELYHKHSTPEKNAQAVHRFHKAGIGVHGMFVLGADTDDEATIEETLNFARKSRIDTAQFFILTPLPGTRMTKRYEAEGRILTRAWHKYDAQHALIEHKEMKPADLQKSVDKIGQRFYSYRDAMKSLFRGQDRIYNSVIRIGGKHLAHKIVNTHKDHILFLEELDNWNRDKWESLDVWKKECLNTIGACPDKYGESKNAWTQTKYNSLKQFLKQKEFFNYTRYEPIKHYCHSVIARIEKEAQAFLKEAHLGLRMDRNTLSLL